MGWVAFIGLVAVALGVLWLPGSMTLWVLGIRDSRAVLLGPAIGIAWVGVLVIVGSFLGGWSWWYPAGLCLSLCITLLLQLVRNPVWLPASTSRTLGAKEQISGSITTRGVIYGLLGTTVFVIIYAVIFSNSVVDPGLPQTIDIADAGFHMMGAKLIAETGQVNPFGALGAIRDPFEPSDSFYPTLWHAYVALLIPLARTGAATNAGLIAVGAIVWPLSLAGLATAVAPKSPSAAFWAPVVAATSTLFPGLIMFRWSIDAFGVSVPLFIGGLAATIWRIETKERAWIYVLFLMIIGSVVAQPSTTLIMLIMVVATGLSLAIWQAVDAARHDQWPRSLALAIGAVGSVAAIGIALRYLLRLSYVQVLGSFVRPPLGYRGAISELMHGGPIYPEDATQFVSFGAASYLPWAVLGIVAVVWTILRIPKSSTAATFGAVGLAVALLYLAASGPDNMLRILTGPWYKDHFRLATFVIALASVAAGAAIATCIETIEARGDRRAKVLGASAAAATGLFLFLSPTLGIGGPRDGLKEHFDAGYALELGDDSVLAQEVIPVLQQLDDLVPPGSYILGTNESGAPFAVAFSDSFGFTRWADDSAKSYLINHIDSILTDPEVCHLIDKANVSAVLIFFDADSEENLGEIEAWTHPEEDSGFELLLASEGVELWEITACD